MRADEFVLVQGWRGTRATLEGWNAKPGPTVRRWVLASLAISLLLLVATWIVAKLAMPDPTTYHFPGYESRPRVADVARLLEFNALVLALHAFACVAGFIAGSALPVEAERHSGLWRAIHDRAGPLAILFVSAATLFSLTTQAYVLGNDAASFAAQLHVSPALLLVGLAPHALPELAALFLPLAAWLLASRRGDWHQLLAATFVTVGLAVPVLVVASFVEVYVSPHLLGALAR